MQDLLDFKNPDFQELIYNVGKTNSTQRILLQDLVNTLTIAMYKTYLDAQDDPYHTLHEHLNTWKKNVLASREADIQELENVAEKSDLNIFTAMYDVVDTLGSRQDVYMESVDFITNMVTEMLLKSGD